MLIATRKLIFQGVAYGRGDAVPAESSPNRLALIAAGLLAETPDPAPEPEAERAAAVDPRELTRADLNAHAAAQGVAEPEGYPNKEALLAVLPPEPAAPDEATAGGQPPASDS